MCEEVFDIDSIVSKLAAKSKKNKPDKQSDNIEIDDAQNDLSYGMPDYYKIMGCTSKDSDEEIKKKCKYKLAKFHPDKMLPTLSGLPPAQRQVEQKLYESQYKLVREAYKILNDSDARKYYDLQKKTIDSKNFAKQKLSFDNFIKLQESEKSKGVGVIDYAKSVADMDKKHNFDREKFEREKKIKFGKDDIAKKISDLEQEREQQDMEYPKNKFEKKAFSVGEFNKQWDMCNKKPKSDKKNSGLILWDGIAAGNDEGANSMNYVDINSNYESLYDDDRHGNQLFASTVSTESEYSDQSSDEINFKQTDYYESHNKGKSKDEINKKLKEMMDDRNTYDKRCELEGIGMMGSVTDNPLNVSAQMGKVIGNNKIGGTLEYKKKLDKDLVNAYKNLLNESN
jgi:curved DNA-binding protein CbpA